MLLEVCVDGIESALAAAAGGADRLEICGSLATGGITPSVGLIHHCRDRCGTLQAMVMIRPHDGGFCYSKNEIGTMLRDIDVAKELGVSGVVLGALSPDGTIDREQVQRLMDTARPLEVTFHRAFDLVREPMEALDALLDLGLDRLLTSGMARSAELGAALIGQLVRHAGDRLTVMAGAGITPDNVARVASDTGVREIHASASVARQLPSVTNADVNFGTASRVTSIGLVQALVAAMGKT